MTRKTGLVFCSTTIVTAVVCFSVISHAYLRMPSTACQIVNGTSSSLRASYNSNGTLMTNMNVGDVTVNCPVTVPEPKVFHNLNVHYNDGNPSTAFSANVCVIFFSNTGGTCFGAFVQDAPSFVNSPWPGGTFPVQTMSYPTFNTWENNPFDFPFVSVTIPASQFSGGVRQNSSTLQGLFVFE